MFHQTITNNLASVISSVYAKSTENIWNSHSLLPRIFDQYTHRYQVEAKVYDEKCF